MIYPWQADDWNRLQQLRGALAARAAAARTGGHRQAALRAASRARPAVRGAAAQRRAVRRVRGVQLVRAGQSSGLPRRRARGAGRRSRPGRRRRRRKPTRPTPTKARRPARPARKSRSSRCAALLDFCGVGSHRGGVRVVVLYPAEALNIAAANALLKTLEEPPAGVVFLMVSARIDRLLPTIISRCRQWPMTVPAPGSGDAVARRARRRRCARAARRSRRRAAHRARARQRREPRAARLDARATRRRARLRRLRVRRGAAEAARAAGARLAAALDVRSARAAHGGRAALFSAGVGGA